MVGQDKRMLWHPRHDNKFVVSGGSHITLYEWIPASSQIKPITSQHDLNLMKCFAWSPASAFEDLIAVGLSSGRVDLIRLEATKYARNHVLSSGPSVSLPVRNSRACNALAFCTADPNYLAVGLDKVRADHSLFIWDIHTATPALCLKTGDPSSSASTVSAPAARSKPLLPRGDLGPRMDSRILQQHATMETISSVAFLPQATNLLIAGISHRWLRFFDLRSPTSSFSSVATKVHEVAVDPLDPYRIGSFGDGIATIWDTRHFSQPFLTFTEQDASADGAKVGSNSVFTTMEFSSTRRGVLATLGKDATHVRFWDLQQSEVIERNSGGPRSRDSFQSSKVVRSSWANPSSMLPWPVSSGSNAASSPKPGESFTAPYHLVLSNTRKTKSFSRPLASFSLVPSADTHPLTSNLMVVNKEGDLELYAVHDTPVHTPWSARGDLAMGIGRSYKILPGFHDSEPPPEPWDIETRPSIPGSTPHSVDRYLVREEPDRSSPAPPAATFGRGDEDGFPALSPSNERVTAASRLGKHRTNSPAALHNLHSDHTMSVTFESEAPETSTSSSGETLHVDTTVKNKYNHSRLRDNTAIQKHTPVMVMHHLVEDDISMHMRLRTIRGYGLTNLEHNAMVTCDNTPGDTILSRLWIWIHYTAGLLCTPTSRIDGYNFAYQGLWDIWTGFRRSNELPSVQATPRTPARGLLEVAPPFASGLTLESHRARSKNAGRHRHLPSGDFVLEEFQNVITILNARISSDSSWTPSVTTAKLEQRQLALQLCGWSLADDVLGSAVKSWERENKYTQAACWLVFTDRHKQAAELLMRSKDESLHMMSGLVAALTLSSASHKNHELREHCDRLIVKLQDPYLRVMLTYLTVKDWSEVVQEEALPLRERLAIAFQFLDDDELTSYLQRVLDRCKHDGDIEGLFITGITPDGMDILQMYLDTTGDIQSTAILAALNPMKAFNSRETRWLDAYRDLLDGWKLFHHRCQFDIDYGQILQEAEQNGEMVPFDWAPLQILIRCNYCHKPTDPPFPVASNPRPTSCPHCGRPLPRCSICLMTIGIMQDPLRNAELAHSSTKDTIDEALVFCQTCRHGGHASHILEWFYGEDGRRSHGTCAVANCDCHCADKM